VKTHKIPVCPDCGERTLDEDGHYHDSETNFHRAEQVEVVPLSEVKDALLSEEAIKAGCIVLQEAAAPRTEPWVRLILASAVDAAFPSTDSEGQG